MRPQLLKISGLNSFVQEEVIDFQELVSRGLFGIFGPTGSGKSTILDAITIALYGEIARDTKEFINKEIGELYVYLEYTMGDNGLVYSVDRKLRLSDNKGYLTSFVRFVIKKNEQILEVYEGVREVRDKVEEVIGLNHEDFMRTVVLPQGKFSRFLKLKGRERRDMLERLLNLEEFGERLMDKIRNRRTQKRSQLGSIETVLASYEEVSPERLEQERAELAELNSEVSKHNIELRDNRKKHEEFKEVWQLQNQLEGYQEKLGELLEKQEEITAARTRLEKTRKAVSIKSEIIRYDRYQHEYKQNVDRLSSLDKENALLREKMENFKGKYEECLREKEEKLPEITTIKVKLEAARELFKENKELIEVIDKKKKHLQSSSRESDNLQKKLQLLQDENKNNTGQIEQLEKKIEGLTISSTYREKLTTGLAVENNYKKTKEQSGKIDEQLAELEENIKIQKGELAVKREALEECEVQKLKQYNREISKYNKRKEGISEKKEKIEAEIEKVNGELRKLIEGEEELRLKNMAGNLAREIKKGAPCPVCGSTEHPLIAEVTDIDFSIFKEEREQLEVKLKNLNRQINDYLTEYSLLTRELERMKNEMTVLEQESSFDPSKLDNGPGEVDNDLSILKRKREELKVELVKVTTALEGSRENIEKLKQQKEEYMKELTDQKNTYYDLLNQFKIESFSELMEEVKRKDREREEEQSKLKKLRYELTENNQKIEVIKHDLQTLEKEITALNHQLENLTERYQRNREEITKKAGNRDPVQYLKEIEEQEQKIKEQFIEKKKSLDHTTQLLNDKSGDRKVVKQTLKNLEKEIAAIDEYLQKKIKEYQFNDYKEVKDYLKNENEVSDWEKQVEQYEEEKKDLENNLERVKKDLDSRSITEEEWVQLQQEINELEEKLKKMQEKLGSYNANIERLKKDLEHKEEQLLQKKELNHELDLISDIDDLIRGKSFVEYVAMKQLRYIAREASRRLMEITNGRYILEVDNQGEFVICDKYNGGVSRDCNTLSGGETFLTSLALALALSSQIQLKGNSSMEFFFLDEGFGTLDANLLDVVMNSLERLQNENLAVGVISHVEELKNRVPIKLIVQPAQPGLQGSKVLLEYT